MKDPEGNGSLLVVAEAVGDGRPVDWEREIAARPDLRQRLARLKVLEAVAAVHRQLPDSLLEETRDSGAPAASPARPPIPSHWGHLRILERLGRGGFGEVYRAFDPRLEREVALKLLRADREKRALVAFLEEARKQARVRHPNVLVIHGADVHDGRPGIWTDLVHGRTLEECLAVDGPFSEREAANIGVDLCRALAAVHAAGLLHRDVKTSNVMREKGGRIVLMDFGSVGEIAPVDSDSARQTSGTPAFMAPEVLLEGRPATVQSDLYSLGALLYRLVSGRDPVSGVTVLERADRLRRGEVMPLLDARSDLSPSFARIVEKALNHDPSQRYSSAGILERALAGREPASAPAPPRRLHAIAAAAAAVLAIALVLTLWILWPGPSFQVEAALYRQGGTTQERLLQGSRVSLGDLVFMEVRGSTPLYVYVLNEDQTGGVWALFPIGLDLSNPLPSGVTHRLPGRQGTEQKFWKLSTAGGRETLLVVASRTPLDYVERELAALPRPGTDNSPRYAQISEESTKRLLRGMSDRRGIGEIAGAAPGSRTSAPGSLSRITSLLPGEGRTDEGIWWWQIQLEGMGQ